MITDKETEELIASFGVPGAFAPYAYFFGDSAVILDGTFRLEHLKKIVELMESKQAASEAEVIGG